ncbi:MAG TPA: hypothetical protein GXX51_07150 [Firmicutes bacterium]|nr:hypothetical protein [Bacillota bacterium]
MRGKDNPRQIPPVVILSLLLLITLSVGLMTTRIFQTRRSEMPPLRPEGLIPERLSRRGLTHELLANIQGMFDKRANALIKGEPGAIRDIYSAGGGNGNNKALEHEMRRIRYVTAWAAKRGFRFTGSDVYLQIRDIETRGDVILLDVWQSLNLRYTNPGYTHMGVGGQGKGAGQSEGSSGSGSDAFGIRTRHKLELVRAGDGKWLIRKDEYTDPLGEDTLVPEVAPAMSQTSTPPAEPTRPAVPTVPATSNVPTMPVRSLAMAASPIIKISPTSMATIPTAASSSLPTSMAPEMPVAARRGRRGRGGVVYDRRAAVAYANKYCGVKTRDGKRFGYNPRYKDYTDLGGDCTNFISQVLGDREGGRLPMDDIWYYDFTSGDNGKGSSAWTETEPFRDYLLASGIARCLARGDYYSVTRQTREFPRGAINELREGDLIAYEEKGDIQHFAVVVGRDSAGYTLVNSHTADRYRVPWDLGWDKRTIFWLLKVS